MKGEIRRIFYVCSVCKSKRYINISQSYHLRKAHGGLTNYNDFHLCGDKLEPTIISVDANYDVRGQKRGNAIEIHAKSIIPSPKPKIETYFFDFDDEVKVVFKYVEVLNLITLSNYHFGDKDDSMVTVLESSTGLFKVTYELQDNIKQFDDIVQQRFLDMLIALEIGRNVNIDVIKSLILFIVERPDLQPTYVDKQVMIEMTSASTVWLSWQGKNSYKYLKRHASFLLSDTGLEIADKMLPLMKDGKNSLEMIAESTGLYLSSVVSIAFLLELWGILKYEYRDQSPIQV
ncbi:MAG: hypothetical protein INQ03_03110 [Candidatus Heimdallarchaeota archaeon]|nr:hypothetical protein [Candidatus Heimdallarchaeota archaeon]